MAPVNEQITAMERCERAVESVFSRLQQTSLHTHGTDQAPEQLHLQSGSATKQHPLLRAA